MVARADGWADAEFWDATPALLISVLRRSRDVRRAQAQADDYRAGMVTAMLLNVNRSKNGKLWFPHDLFASLRTDEPGAEQVKEIDAEQQAEWERRKQEAREKLAREKETLNAEPDAANR